MDGNIANEIRRSSMETKEILPLSLYSMVLQLDSYLRVKWVIT